MKYCRIFLLFFIIIVFPNGFCQTVKAENKNPSNPSAEKQKLSPLEQKLGEIKVNQIKFENTPLDSAIEMLQNKIKSLAQNEKDINIVLMPQDEGESPTLTLVLDNVNLASAISAICKAVNYEFFVDDYAIVIHPAGKSLQRFETRRYPMSIEVCNEIFRKDINEFDGTISLNDYFESNGVLFPSGSRIIYDSRLYLIIAINTPQNLEKIEYILEYLNKKYTEPEVYIEVKLLYIPSQVVAGIALSPDNNSANSPLKDAHKMLSAKGVQVIAGGAALTKNSEEATIRFMTEKYLPAYWSKGIIVSPREKSKDTSYDEEKTKGEEGTENKTVKEKIPVLTGQQAIVSAVPQFSEPTELGFSLRVTPTVDADYYTIALDVVLNIQSLAGWTDFPLNNGQQARAKMPNIQYFTSATPLQMYDEAIQIIGSISVPKDAGVEMLVLLECATLVNSDGTKYNQEIKKPGDNQASLAFCQFFNWNNIPEDISRKLMAKKDFTLSKGSLAKAFPGLKSLLESSGLPCKFEIENPNDISTGPLSASDMPIGEILRYFCMQTNLYSSYENNQFVFKENNFETINYKVRRSLFMTICEVPEKTILKTQSSEKKASEKPVMDEALKAYFSERGISFQKGSIIYYDRNKSAIIMKNTRDNQWSLADLLRAVDIEIPLVDIEISIVEISSVDLSEFWGKGIPWGPPPEGFLNKLMGSGKAKLIAAPTVLAMSGQEAITRLEDGRQLPFNWTEPEVKADENAVCIIPPSPSLSPTSLGSELVVTPTVNSDKHHIDLSLNPKLSDLTGWTEYPGEINILSSGAEKRMDFTIRMPDILRKDILTSVKVVDGGSLCIGYAELGFDPLKDSWKDMTDFSNGKVVFFFVKAVLTNPDGQPVRAEK